MLARHSNDVQLRRPTLPHPHNLGFFPSLGKTPRTAPLPQTKTDLEFYVHIGIMVSLIFFHSQGKTWLDSKLARKARRRDSVSKYGAQARRDSSRSTGKGVHLVPPMPDSVKEMKS
jgi:hypothetical protein